MIVFDVGGVLLKMDQNKVAQFRARNMPKDIYTAYVNCDKKLLNEKMYALLESIPDFDDAIKNHNALNGPGGSAIPPIMLAWLAGLVSNQSLNNKINHALSNSIFENDMEEKLLEYELKLMFNPYFFVETRSTLNPMIELLHQLCATKRHTIILCSNWDSASFELSKQRFPEIFDFIDQPLISAYEHIVKPDPEFFKRIEEKYPCTDGYIFIDDQEENRAAAELFGFNCVHPDDAYQLCKKMNLLNN